MSDMIRRVLKRHIREKAVVHEAAKNVQPLPDDGHLKSSRTVTGLPVQEQVEKEWNPKKGGLPIFHPTRY
jgi:hypothetical protein